MSRRRVLVVHCHPATESLCDAARRRVLDAAERAGAEVRMLDLYADGFSPEMTADERHHHREPGVAPELEPHAEALAWCDTLVLTYPTWWSGQPAMLKGWFDRVWVSGVAWELPEGANKLRGLLRNIRHIVVVTTHGSSKAMNALEGEAGKRTITRSLRAMCHPLTRTHWVALYGVDTCTSTERTAFLDRVDRRITRLAGRR